MIVPSKIVFADEKTKRAFEELKAGRTDEIRLFEFLERAFLDIEKNAFCGILIPKDQIPKWLRQKYGIDNLRKYKLPDGWRLFYTVKSEQVMVISIVLEWMTHKDSERKFGYKRS